jgi:hypothetical protein
MMMQGTVAMADYYSLISRAVAALETNTLEARRVIYNYARAAQSEQLHNRPFNKKDFDHERLMLEDAISRVEIEVTGGRIPTGPSPGTRVRPSNIATSLPPVETRKGATVIAQAIRKTISALQKCLLLVRRFRHLRHTIWQVLFRRGEGFAEPCACAVKHPAISDFHTSVAKAGVGVPNVCSVTVSGTTGSFVAFCTNKNWGRKMNRRDQELLDKQMRRLSAPRHNGVIAVMLAVMFVVGMTLGSVLSEHKTEPIQIASLE